MAQPVLALVLGLVLSLVACRLVVLVHELGHAAVGLVRSDGLVGVRVGRSPSVWRIRLGRLQLFLHPLPARNESDGRVTVYAQLGRTSQVMYVLAGPLAGCSAALLFVLLGARTELWILVVTGCVLFAGELRNFWPSERRAGRDGTELLKAIRGRGVAYPADPIVEVEKRWLLLVTDSRRALGARDQRLFSGVLAALDRAPEDRSDDARALRRLAYCGWCWREAERGDTTPIRASVLDACQHARSSGATGIDITTTAADELVREGVDLAAASPLADSLEKGLPCACNNVSTGSLTQGRVRFAFHFGIALHDVMTIAG